MAGDRLLVVDDEPEVARQIRRIAEEIGFEVTAATDAAAFRRAYAGGDPTVIVLDIVMPDTDGIELVNWLAEQRANAALILVSGFDPRYLGAAAEIATNKGLDVIAALTKPLDTATFRAALRARYRAEKKLA